MAAPSSSPSSSIPFLIKGQDGTIHVRRIKISDGDSNDTCVRRIRALFPEDTNVGLRFAKQLLRIIMMREPVVGTVCSFQVSSKYFHETVQAVSDNCT
jgi:hypothetical protein